MRRKRVYSDIEQSLSEDAEAKAKKIGISQAKLIEIALKSELGRFNVHKENKRLTEARASAENETEELRQQLATAEAEHKDTCERLEREKAALICNRYDEQVKSLKKESDTFKAYLKQIASHLGVPDTPQHCTQRIDELQASIENRVKERDCFKAKFEESESNCRTCNDRLTRLLTRNWWDRLWNVLPWITETSLPTDETIE